jgi:transcriptional regulator with XRE-family HTH domain
MPRKVTLAEQLDLLFEYGKARGLPVTYRAIAEATGENANKLRKLHAGENNNPGLRTIAAIAKYFGIKLAYFECVTKTECRNLLSDAAPQRLQDSVTRLAADLSKEGLETLITMIDYVRKAEKLPPVRD